MLPTHAGRCGLCLSHTWYYLDYEFRKGMLTIAGSANVNRTRWDSVHIGDRIAITYLRRSPHASLPIARNEMTLFDVFEPLLPFFVGLLLLPVPLLILRHGGSRVPRLVHDGAAVLGKVVTVNGARVRYSFPGPEGDVNGGFLYRSPALPAPAIGDSFVVLYNPKRLSESVAWPIARVSFEGIVPTKPAATPDIDVNAPFRVRISWQVPLLLLFCAALATPFAVVTNHARQLRANVAHLQANGVETWGTVVTMIQIGRDEWTRIRFHYRDLDAIYLTSSMRIQERFRRGSPTPVTYAMDDPTIALPFRKSELSDPRLTQDVIPDLVFGIFVLTVVALFLAYIVWRTSKEWRLAHGRMRIATINEVRGRVFRKCRYRFMADHGEVEHEVRIHSNTFRPAESDRIAIVYEGARSVPAGDLVFVRRLAPRPA